MREPFTGTLPCPLGREGAQAKLRLAGLPLSRWRPGKSSQQYFDRWLLPRWSTIPEVAKRPARPVRCRAWVRPPVENRFDPSCTLPNGRKRADAITLEALNTENAYNSRTKTK